MANHQDYHMDSGYLRSHFGRTGDVNLGHLVDDTVVEAINDAISDDGHRLTRGHPTKYIKYALERIFGITFQVDVTFGS